MTAHDPDDDTAEKASGTTRRRFLGAAAAAAGLPALTTRTAATTTRNVDVTHGAHGTRKATLPERGDVSAFLELHSLDDYQASFQAEGYHFSDNPDESHVGIKISLNGASLSVTPDPERARELGEDILAAADHAEHGDDAE